MKISILFALTGILLLSCSEKPKETSIVETKTLPLDYLPFQEIELKDLSAFRDVSDNWKVVGNATVNRTKDGDISFSKGTGVLINIPEDSSKDHLLTKFEHGDIELELDVLLPKGSNSGLYFQGRYEIQLFDSWGVAQPQHSDIGGIYQRWDEARGKDKEGFEGIAPLYNAAKAPGLWQRLKIIFHAPEFDDKGNKVKNAEFEKVWLNGMLIHENAEVTGPTRAAAFNDEAAKGPLMIQGDHGAVALKNITYKRYDAGSVALKNMSMTEFQNGEIDLPKLDSLVPIRQIRADSISANMISGETQQGILKYTGQMEVPTTGEYLFDFKINRGGGILLVDHDTVVNMNGDYNLDSLGIGKVNLDKGDIPFTLIYNKPRSWATGFSLEVEGPGVQKHALQAKNSLVIGGSRPEEKIMIEVGDVPIAQRSFMMQNGYKRTHCISVGTPRGVHFAYDLSTGSLLKAWNGDFLDATDMWLSRGEKQLARPAGFTLTFYGGPDFAILEDEASKWPDTDSERANSKSLGYSIMNNGMPMFSYQLGDNKISDLIVPSGVERIIKRTIRFKGNETIWHNIAIGESIQQLPDGTYIVNDESYYIDFSNSGGLQPIVRESSGKDELLVKIPAGEQHVEYNIIW
ncbi:3-keto-disaccharide hydrolase [Pareuzebyella sediminis]|uniref:3-keto-disaccharide hydrolase n=1 Tax=Pareuzebyella sediminis TaxID=2607998 RepID=UPI0011F00C80|nr:DUF1080 domain-containing protein [Pareuzebyella sediminis]